jgi:hypothetical protein
MVHWDGNQGVLDEWDPYVLSSYISQDIERVNTRLVVLLDMEDSDHCTDGLMWP